MSAAQHDGITGKLDMEMWYPAEETVTDSPQLGTSIMLVPPSPVAQGSPEAEGTLLTITSH